VFLYLNSESVLVVLVEADLLSRVIELGFGERELSLDLL
jgi:hypothetical protein